MKTRQRLLSLTACWLTATTAGCATSTVEPSPSERIAATQVALIAGFPADSPEFNAIGSIGVAGLTPTQPPRSICTGTLIAPDLVLTAKHCTRVKSPLSFGIGPAANSLQRVVPVIAIERAPDVEGGYPPGVSNDVAVLHLAEPITDVEPLAWKQLTDADVGSEFTAIGYGQRDTTGASGVRTMGRTELIARRGRGFELVFGTFDAFFKWFLESSKRDGLTCRQVEAREKGQQMSVLAPLPTDDGECSPEYLQLLHERYDTFLLETSGQVLVGAGMGEGQTCFGDSGGPLLKAGPDGALSVYGVVSWGFDSADLPCDYGGFYTALDGAKADVIAAAPDWVDPCGTIDADGVCNGAVATRCTTGSEGTRRLVELDCSGFGLACQPRKDGHVGCGDAGPEPPASTPPTVPPHLPTNP